MTDNKRFIDANGHYAIKAADNTDHMLCFCDGIISVQDERGHVLCEFHADDVPTVAAEEIVTGKWDGQGNCSVCNKNIYDDIDADMWSQYTPSRCPNCGAHMII